MKRYLRRGYRKTTDVSQPARIAVLVDDDHPFGDVISDLLVDRERDELLALGAAAILAKPFDVEDLVKLVGQHLPARGAPLTTAVQKPIRRGYFPDDVASAFSRWLDSPGARLLMLTSSNPGEFARQARSVWVASWRACAQVVYGLPDDQ